MSLVLAGPSIGDGDPAVIGGAGLLLAYTAYRSLRPVRYRDDVTGVLLILAEAAVSVGVITATGYWSSPLAFALVSAVAVAGFARGFAFGLQVALLAVLAVSVPWSLESDYDDDQDPRTSVQWSVEMLLVGVVSAYARRISVEAEQRQTLALDRLGRLSDANALLFQLHQVTQTLPASLDLDEVLDATLVQISDLFDHTSLALYLLGDTDNDWHLARRDGPRPPSRLSRAALPPPLDRAVRTRGLVNELNLDATGGPGLSGSANSGLYAALLARGALVGVLAIEHTEARHYSARDADLLAGFVESAALAIDNARWFGRLRTVGADEERTRIARDLHDRIGQSLAYLAFELDRIVKSSIRDKAVTESLDHLREDVRGVIREVRDTLYDLRTDVTEAMSLPVTLEAFLDRVRERSGLEVGLRAQETGRLPILQEREMWRIAQEAVTNVERHAEATQVMITWRCDGTTAVLEVADDGRGFPKGHVGRLDSYGIMGMRERAASIGATLSVDSEPGKGTRVRCAVTGH